VPVPVVQIRPVGVCVNQRLVAVPMGVARRGGQVGMRVGVVAVVVSVAVDVLGRLVAVLVAVLRQKQERHGE
jgi:hypothetical protein